MEISLSGKVVLVTGASRGIGAAIAQACDQSGASVALHYNANQQKAEQVLTNMNERSKAFQANLADTKDIVKLFEQIIECFGRLDVLVNNAGIAISSDMSSSVEEWVSDWDKTFAVNTRAQGLLCKLAIEEFEKVGAGRIINISSRAAFRGDTPDYLAYGASKGAIASLTRSIARYYGKKNITAFNIAPGFVRTDMAQDFMDQYGEDYALNDIALNQLTQPKDLAPMIVLLASGLADHATGCTIDINAASYVH
ncbi:SDR family NAD(P)-dependent oxidoreductase [Roseivirga sp.]|uniref:SDR family NAD(P)-dependent oxidoreductase n=1 Tax=Roseivirga sp. TaxID=1964215 RepID=UPI003B51EC8B